MVSCPPARFLTCTRSWGHLCFPVLTTSLTMRVSWYRLNHDKGSALVEASGCCVNPSLQIALQGFGAQRWMDINPFLYPCLQSVTVDIPSYLVIHTGDLLAQSMTLCWFMCWLLGTNPRPGSRGSIVDCSSMAPVLEGKFGEGQRAADLASGAGSKDSYC